MGPFAARGTEERKRMADAAMNEIEMSGSVIWGWLTQCDVDTGR